MNNFNRSSCEQILKSGSTQGYRQLMQFCNISYNIYNATLSIDCPTFDDADALLNEYGEELCSKIIKLKVINMIEMKAAGETLYCYPPELIVEEGTHRMTIISFTERCLVSPTDKALRDRVDQSGYPTTVILMPDNQGKDGHKGLYANTGITEVCGLELNDWIGKDMRPGWSIHELQKFMGYLTGDTPGRRLTEYTYQAWKLTGEPIELCVNVDLDWYQGSLVRIVNTLGMQLL